MEYIIDCFYNTPKIPKCQERQILFLNLFCLNNKFDTAGLIFPDPGKVIIPAIGLLQSANPSEKIFQVAAGQITKALYALFIKSRNTFLQCLGALGQCAKTGI